MTPRICGHRRLTGRELAVRYLLEGSVRCSARSDCRLKGTGGPMTSRLIVCAVFGVLFAVLASARTPHAEELPEGPNRELVRHTCTESFGFDGAHHDSRRG